MWARLFKGHVEVPSQIYSQGSLSFFSPYDWMGPCLQCYIQINLFDINAPLTSELGTSCLLGCVGGEGWPIVWSIAIDSKSYHGRLCDIGIYPIQRIDIALWWNSWFTPVVVICVSSTFNITALWLHFWCPPLEKCLFSPSQQWNLLNPREPWASQQM